MNRRTGLDSFYEMLRKLQYRVGGFRYLMECTSKTGWPQRGLYFFFENGEFREDGKTPRVVRVGTHAVSDGSRTTLWNRLHTHRGYAEGKGNHRGSIFRKRVGEALLVAGEYPKQIQRTWGRGASAPKNVCFAEQPLEMEVSRYIGQMPLLWLDVDDQPSKFSKRAYLERNCIALLGNFNKTQIDPPSPTWLGLGSPQQTIRESGLWNTHYVDADYEPAFLKTLSSLADEM